MNPGEGLFLLIFQPLCKIDPFHHKSWEVEGIRQIRALLGPPGGGRRWRSPAPRGRLCPSCRGQGGWRRGSGGSRGTRDRERRGAQVVSLPYETVHPRPRPSPAPAVLPFPSSPKPHDKVLLSGVGLARAPNDPDPSSPTCCSLPGPPGTAERLLPSSEPRT